MVEHVALPSPQETDVPVRIACGGSKVRHTKTIHYLLAVGFIIASFISAMFATTRLAGSIWRAADRIFSILAHISNASSEEVERSKREARIISISDAVKVVMTRRYVHDMRYSQEMAMTVVQLEEQTIFYNPLPMLHEDMRSLARGKHVVLVAPNMYHHMFVDDYINVFPSAVLVGSQRAAERHDPHLAVALPSTLALPNDVELLHVDGFALDEYIMIVHSAQLFSAAHFITCGVELSVGGSALLPDWLKQVVCRACRWHSGGCLSLYERLAVTDTVAAASFVSRLHKLELQIAVSAHGGVCEDHAQSVLNRAWGWTGSQHAPASAG